MRRPPTFDEADARGLLTREKDQNIHTFSNGTDGYGWMEWNCAECWFFDKDCIGALCAFEAAAQMHMVTPELARLFGFEQQETKYGPRSGWHFGQCGFFHQRPDAGDDGEDIPLPPPTDPHQLILIADPTEDLAQFPSSLPEPQYVEALVGAVVAEPLEGAA